MIITWIKSDGSKFMAKLDDTMEQTLLNFLLVNKAQKLTEEEIKIHNGIADTNEPRDTNQAKKWWKI